LKTTQFKNAIFFTTIKKYSTNNVILFCVYTLCFLYLIFQDAIYSPDTASHFKLEVWRSPVYSSFVFLFKKIFSSYFDIVTVSFQLIIGFAAVHLFYKKISVLLSLPLLLNILLFIVLIFPFFNPLMNANNICSEGFSYPLYLLTICYGFSFLYENKNFWWLLLFSMSLSLTRAQFILIPIIIAFVYIIKKWNAVNKTRPVLLTSLLIGSLFINILIDKTYHKITKDQFVSTSSFFIANTAAMYVSETNDIKDINEKEAQAVFKLSREYSDKKGLLMETKKEQSALELYNDFHNNLTQICSYSFHYKGTMLLKETKGYSVNKARVNVEKAAKNMMPTLVKNNFKKYIKLYYGNLIHGVKSQLLLFLIIGLFFYSLFKILKSYNKDYSIVFILSSLILSNALIVSFGSYSIVRLLFYHYSLIVLLLFYSSKVCYKHYKN